MQVLFARDPLAWIVGLALVAIGLLLLRFSKQARSFFTHGNEGYVMVYGLFSILVGLIFILGF